MEADLNNANLASYIALILAPFNYATGRSRQDAFEIEGARQADVGNIQGRLCTSILGAHELQDHAAHYRVCVIAIGLAVPADQAAILKLRQRPVEVFG
jgi:hypothetical protein